MSKKDKVTNIKVESLNSETESEEEDSSIKQMSLTNLKGIFKTFWSGYKEKTPKKIKLMDSFVIFCLMITAIQFLYVFVVGQFPQNSFIIGLLTPVGAAVLTVCLRQQINEKTRYMNISNDRSFWEYFVAMYILFLACINYLG